MLRAVAAGDTDLIKKLLGQGVDVDGTTAGGQTALMLASISGHSEVVQLLLSAGANAQLRDRLGLTALDWSKRRGFSEVTELLGPFEKLDTAIEPPKSEQIAIDSAPPAPAKDLEIPEPAAQANLESTLPAPAKDLEMLEPAAQANLESTPPAPSTRALQSPEPTEQVRNEIDPSENENKRREQIAKIQAFFDQLSVDQATAAEETKPNGSATGTLDNDQSSEEEKLRLERLRAEDERISRAHRLKNIDPVTESVSLSSNQEQSSLEAEPPSVTVEAERAANELSRESSRLAAERMAEEARRRVIEEVRKKVLRQEQEAAEIEETRPHEKSTGEQRVQQGTAVVFQDAPTRQVQEAVQQTSPLRATRIITPDLFEPVRPITRAATLEPTDIPKLNRCPKCNADFTGESCPECAKDELSVFGSAAEPSILARPMLWMLLSVTLAGGVFIGYQLNEFLSKSATSSAPLVSAPVEQPASPKPAVTPEVPDDRPLVGGALSGAEARIPEPEYPQAAKKDAVEATITVRVRVNSKGRVILARSSSGDWRLRAAAVKAAKQATFSPERLPPDQRVIPGTITYTFKSGSQNP